MERSRKRWFVCLFVLKRDELGEGFLEKRMVEIQKDVFAFNVYMLECYRVGVEEFGIGKDLDDHILGRVIIIIPTGICFENPGKIQHHLKRSLSKAKITNLHWQNHPKWRLPLLTLRFRAVPGYQVAFN